MIGSNSSRKSEADSKPREELLLRLGTKLFRV